MANLGEGIDPNWKAASKLEEDFAMLWVTDYPELDLRTEYQFSDRNFRFDFASLDSKVAIELQGGIWQSVSGHNSGTGITTDYEKFNLAQSLGWQVYLLTADSYHLPEMLQMIAQAILKRSSVTRLT